MDACLSLGYAVTEIEYNPEMMSSDGRVFKAFKNPDLRFGKMISGHPGIFLVVMRNGFGHAVAWDGQTIYDPGGRIYSMFDLEDQNVVEIESFLRIDKIKSSP